MPWLTQLLAVLQSIFVDCDGMFYMGKHGSYKFLSDFYSVSDRTSRLHLPPKSPPLILSPPLSSVFALALPRKTMSLGALKPISTIYYNQMASVSPSRTPLATAVVWSSRATYCLRHRTQPIESDISKAFAIISLPAPLSSISSYTRGRQLTTSSIILSSSVAKTT